MTNADWALLIAQSPDDEVLYNAFIDWLEERGDPAAALFRLCQQFRPSLEEALSLVGEDPEH